jgi:iron-sulfur cluster assembly protein
MVETLARDADAAVQDTAEAITMTPEAVLQAKKLLARKFADKPEMGFRVGVRGGGCSGLSYFMDMDDQPTASDHVFDSDGVKVIVDPKSFPYLKGMSIVWSGNLMAGGFEFNNPNEKSSCGCGTSFSV